MSDSGVARANNVTVYLMIEYHPQRIVSVAGYDERRRLIQIGSFLDNEHYSNLESIIIQMNPKQDSSNFKVHASIRTDIKSQKNKVLEKMDDINYILHDTWKSSNSDVSYFLGKLLKKDLNMYIKDMEDKKAILAMEKLISVLQLEKDETNRHKLDLQTMKIQKYMKMDKAVINSLQIFPKDLDKKIVSGSNTLFEIINQCKTNIGVRCLKRWMKQPLQDINALNQRLDKVQFFIKKPQFRNMIQNEIKKLPDLDTLYHVFYKVEAGKKSNVQVNDLIKIYRAIRVLVDLVSFLEQKGKGEKQIADICDCLSKNLKIADSIPRMIEDNIILEQKDNDSHVRPDASEELGLVSKKQNKILHKIESHIAEIEGYLGVDVKKQPSQSYKYVLEADKKKSIQKVKEHSGYKYLTSKQSKITFTTENLMSYCRDLGELQEEYREKQKGILKEMYKIVAGYYPIIEQLSHILSQLDVLTGFATVINLHAGAQACWSRPHFSQNKILGEKIHHPCIYKCIPNDFDIDDNRTVILTGPNMGGKSTYIRTIGVAIYLAHLGCYVPASFLETPIIDCIVTRVGASDMQMKGISTFMSEMIESSCMLNSSTNKSLVLIDELGRGTSTAEGFGIAWGICHQLHTRIKPYCLFATHFHEMTKMSDQVKGICNMYTSCSIKDKRLHLEYKVLTGKMLKSYGIQVAKFLKFPQEIISQAEAYLEFYEKENSNKIEIDIESDTSEDLNEKQKQAILLYKEMKSKILLGEVGKSAQIQVLYKTKIRQLLK